MCGHFPEGVETFEQTEFDEDETSGQWYLHQMLGSANISGSRALHILGRQPLPPDRAPCVSRSAEQPLRRDRSPGSRPVRALRPQVSRRAAPSATRLRLAQGLVSVPAQRLAPGDDPRQRTATARETIQMTSTPGGERRQGRPMPCGGSSLDLRSTLRTMRAGEARIGSTVAGRLLRPPPDSSPVAQRHASGLRVVRGADLRSSVADPTAPHARCIYSPSLRSEAH
jgi:hypothetical protein